MKANVRSCRPSELSDIIKNFDREFICNKKRTLSLCLRFPDVLSTSNCENLRVVVADGIIVAACAIKMFDWIAEKELWHGAMIGMVWVDERYRRKGIGRILLASIKPLLRSKNIDFGILWTGSPKYYTPLGWRLKDNGLFGEADTFSNSLNTSVVCDYAESMDAAVLERLRRRYLPMRVSRSASDYRTIPIPANRVLCFHIIRKNMEGFALVGEKDQTHFFYEIAAPFRLWPDIWSSVTSSCNRLFVNGFIDDPFSRWVEENRLVTWRRQRKAMWLQLSERSKAIESAVWNIPYFDWI